MKNIRIYYPLVDGTECELGFKTCKEVVERLLGEDQSFPPICLVIETTSSDGKKVSIAVPYDDQAKANVVIEELE